MTTFLLRDVDPTLWRKVKARAARDGISLKAALHALLTYYAKYGLPE